MDYPLAYIDYMLEFHGTRDWFECHEIMEEHWKAESSAERKVWWLTLVQIAVGLYHERRGNLAGAGKMLRSALAHAPEVAWAQLGIDGTELIAQLWERVESYRQGVRRSGRMPSGISLLPIRSWPLNAKPVARPWAGSGAAREASKTRASFIAIS